MAPILVHAVALWRDGQYVTQTYLWRSAPGGIDLASVVAGNPFNPMWGVWVRRVYDAVILKTLGATRDKLIGAYALEYLLLGSATALFGVAAGSIAAWLVVTRVMNLTFVWLPGPAAAAAFGALLVTVALGLVGTFTALGHKPATVLRNL